MPIFDSINLKVSILLVKCSFCGSGGWVAFEDEKCFKFVNRVVTYEEAEQTCNNQARSSPTLNFLPTLVSIKSQEEQQFLEKYLFEKNGALDSVWISAKRKTDNETIFEWNDGSELEYNNWAQGYPTSNTGRKCVQIQSEYSFKNSTNLIESSTEGKWADIPCERNNLVVCEKLQIWSFPQLQKTLLDIRNNLRQNPVPTGFIYAQLPSQPEPKTLWPTVEWTDVTSDYAGLFFRAEGGWSAAFGVTQNENSPRLTDVQQSPSNSWQDHVQISPNNEWSSWVYSGDTVEKRIYATAQRFKVSSGEVRPRNKAIRIWKRTN
jgi:hypothetical protein